jgi:hypothetical protein
MLQNTEMKKPVEWWHLIFQTTLFVSALLGMLWNFSTSTQKQKDDIQSIKDEIEQLKHERHDDALLHKADMDELKGAQKEINQKVTDILVILQNKKDRDK